MDDRWYYSHAEERFGPYSARQLRDLAGNGELLPTDTVYKDGVERGVQANRVKNLFPLPAAAIPVPPPIAVPAPVGAATTRGGDLLPSIVPDLVPLETKPQPTEIPAAAPTPTPARTRPAHQSKGRAVAGKGVTIVGQDGVYVRFRKKCTTCKHEDYATNSLAIRTGTMQMNFFCPKCRKNRTVEMLGSLH